MLLVVVVALIKDAEPGGGSSIARQVEFKKFAVNTGQFPLSAVPGLRVFRV